MSSTPVPFDSDALRANIASTAQEVVIPDRYLPLVEAVDGLHGVKASLVETLGEYFHVFRNVDSVVEGFQTILLRNWSYFERSDARDELFALFAELVLELLRAPLTTAQRSLQLRSLLTWTAQASGGPRGDAYDEPLLARRRVTHRAPARPSRRLPGARHAGPRPGGRRRARGRRWRRSSWGCTAPCWTPVTAGCATAWTCPAGR